MMGKNNINEAKKTKKQQIKERTSTAGVQSINSHPGILHTQFAHCHPIILIFSADIQKKRQYRCAGPLAPFQVECH